jgi:hypothetical protein
MSRSVQPLRVLLLALGVSAGARAAEPLALRLIGVCRLPPSPHFAGMRVGGFSGLDYDPASDGWLAISDDRSEHGPARFYTVKLDYDATTVRGATVTAVTLLRQPDGALYPNRAEQAKRGGDLPDFEALRLDPRDGSVWYASEGDASLGLNPFLRRAGREGAFLATLPLPEQFRFSPDAAAGPRPNLSLESLTFAPDGTSLWTACEAPLLQDGPRPTAHAGGLTRLTRLSRTGAVLAQYAYELDAWQLAPAPGYPGDNGLADLLALPDGRLLALERSGAGTAANRWAFAARLYVVDPSRATDVSRQPTLTTGIPAPAAKRLVFDFARSGSRHLDNLEGLAWGRRLPDGSPSLVVVSDDNFLPNQETQFWVFAVTFSP